MANFGVAEAEGQFETLVDRAAAGEEIVIVRDGKPVARLVALIEHDPARAKQAFEQMKELRKGHTLGGLDWKALRDEGRR